MNVYKIEGISLTFNCVRNSEITCIDSGEREDGCIL